MEEFDYLNGISFADFINIQADSTIEVIGNMRSIPFDVITIETIGETSIARLLYEFELLTFICAQYMYINPYDQPGVEAGKIILKDKLNRNHKSISF